VGDVWAGRTDPRGVRLATRTARASNQACVPGQSHGRSCMCADRQGRCSIYYALALMREPCSTRTTAIHRPFSYSCTATASRSIVRIIGPGLQAGPGGSGHPCPVSCETVPAGVHARPDTHTSHGDHHEVLSRSSVV
jgi:hypothetical protein